MLAVWMLLLLPIMDCCTKKRLLTSMTSVCACAAFGLLSIAVSTDYWLFTSEKNKDNGTVGAVYTHVYSGLWHRCEYKGERPFIKSACLSDKVFRSHCVVPVSVP